MKTKEKCPCCGRPKVQPRTPKHVSCERHFEPMWNDRPSNPSYNGHGFDDSWAFMRYRGDLDPHCLAAVQEATLGVEDSDEEQPEEAA